MSRLREDTRPPLFVEVMATERNASQLRRQFHDWLTLDVPTDTVNDLVLVVYEAVANAVEHAYVDHTGAPGPLRLEAHRTDAQVLITVADEGSWRGPIGDRFRGNGIPLMRNLTREVRIERTHRGTVVRFRAQIDASAPGST
ncbi:MAG: ATP-binding protein [Pseudonocardiaceae bacterium]|nr:ATP-binding protein [Pseudonocardiaceae bacterium]